jgi:hypothetical protein
MQLRHWLFASMAAALPIGMGCDQLASQPIPFPKRAYLGETVSVAIDTDSSLAVPGKNHTLSRENVRIQISDQTTSATSDLIMPRAVVLGSSSLGTANGEAKGASEVTIAVFDLPATLPNGFSPLPTEVWIAAVYPDGTEINALLFPSLEIIGEASEGHGPTTFLPSPPDYAPPAAELTLEPLPALRVMAKAMKFPVSWAIGAIQFDVVYETDKVDNPRAYAKTTVAKGYARASEVAPDRARVMVVDPQGLRIRDSASAGPFVDIVFDQLAPFATGDFVIENLLVTNLDGVALVDLRAENITDTSATYFNLFARANQ